MCEYPMLAQRENDRRRDWVGKINWEVCSKIGSDVNLKWDKHEAERK